jgi:hypothetical protein
MISVIQITPNKVKYLEDSLHLIVKKALVEQIGDEISINGILYKLNSEIKELELTDHSSYDTPLGGLAFYITHKQDYESFGDLSSLTKPRIYGTLEVDIMDAQFCTYTCRVRFETEDYEIGDKPEEFIFTKTPIFVKNTQK